MSRTHCAPLSLTLLACLVASPVLADHHERMKHNEEPKLALSGYCPVCITEMKQWVKGKESIQSVYDGRVYYFPETKTKAMFDADPAKFVPALGGDCVVCLVNMGKRVPGDVKYSARHQERVFLFPEEGAKQEFLKNPGKYTNADLALDGKCAVCLAMGHDVPGKPEFAAFHKGMRYLFPSAKEREAFLASPEKFAMTEAGAKDAQFVSVTGKSGCAACSYGVRPIGAPDNLGLAVESPDGRVYVVEGAHDAYPDLYESRFDGLQVQVQGQVIREQGRFSWISPVQVQAIN